MSGYTLAYDATTGNVGTLPAGQHAGYTTGPGVAWTQEQFDDDPGALHICQDAGASDSTADVYDVESGACTPEDLPSAIKRARASYAAATRPGQHPPMVYCSGDSLTPCANAMAGASITGIPFWLADPDISQAQAQALLAAASGPYPYGGIQFFWGNTFDTDLFDTSWLTTQSGTKGSLIQISNSGPAVSYAQSYLKSHQFNITIDGLFGPDTLAVVKAFQASKSLTQDGIVGPDTWAALEAPVKPVPPPVQPVKLETSTVKGTLVNVAGTDPVYFWDGKRTWHVPDPTVLGVFITAGVGDVVSISQAQFDTLGPAVA